ncbi:hypothetical protein [Mycobacterium sp. URHB0044]|uniref:hypothetical protein n=1 Tax=Mycobacterium sp. URHB0044 TaxID=1380386 RepID=UPI000A93A0B0|nr:hypothetical protein [Mycobacterium sp. URHB0044]
MPGTIQNIGMAVTTVVAVATLGVPASAYADPVVPQADSPCSEQLAGTLTKLPDGTTVLQCQAVAGAHRWSTYASPYPNTDTWLSYGPGLRLHGQGKRNPEIMSGRWVGSPLDSDGQCSAEQSAVVSAGEVGPPQLSRGQPGQPLEFEVLPLVFDIALTGDCVWQKVE